MPQIRAFVFDAVGTLLHPEPGVVDVYTAAGRRHGSALDAAEVRSRFKRAFARQETIDRERMWATDESREYQRWRDIVAEVFGNHDPFDDLYSHFAKPDAWRADAAILLALRERGYRVALASNFDARLHAIAAKLLPALEHVIVSSEVGARKPSRMFFSAIEHRLGLPAHDIAFVGDDPINDGQGASDAGMRSLLLGRDVRSVQDLLQDLA